MVDLLLRVNFDDLLDLIKQLPPDQKRIIRQEIDADWSTRFEQALNAIHTDIPPGIPDEEAEADIEQAIREVRSGR